MTNSKICKTVHALLACSMSFVAEGAAPIANQLHSWNIPSEDARKAVRDFGLQAGVAIGAEPQDLQGKRLNALEGTWSVDAALKQLLAGTGLQYIYSDNGRGVVVMQAHIPPAREDQTTARKQPSVHAPFSQPETAVPLVEEIVVSAQKRDENLQDVPVSVQVIGSDLLSGYNLNSLEQAATTIPSLRISDTGAGGQLYVRGVGSGNVFDFDQSVGVFIDDIYHGRAHTTGATFLDLDRVEVLKGPQSTFFGNNAIGGAFNIVSAKPTLGSVDLGARALYGQFDQYTTEGFVNVPLGDTFAFRVAATANGTNGWQTNEFAGENQPHERNQAGRLSLRWHPDDNLDATLKVEATNNVSHDGFTIADCPPLAPFVPAAFCSLALSKGLPTGIASRANTTIPGQGIDLSAFEDVLTINYLLGDHTLTSVTGFYKNHFDERIDAAAVPMDEFNILIEEDYRQFSQELRFRSPSGGKLEYLGGLYVQVDRDNGHSGDLSYFFLTPTVQRIPPLAPLVPYLPLAAGGPNTQEEHSYAAFGSLGWHITDNLKVTGGIRGSWVYKNDSSTTVFGTATADFGGLVPLPQALQPLAGSLIGVTNPATASGSYDGYIPSASIQYNFTPSVMAYARFDQGFKAGIPLQTVSIPSAPIRSEHVNSYEAGFKSEWLQGRIKFNMDAFRSNYRDLQVASGHFDPQGNLIGLVTNAGRTLAQGAELEAQWVASRHFTVWLNTTYLDSKYVSYPNVSDTQLQSFCHKFVGNPGCITAFGGSGDPGALQDLSGKPTGFAPRWSGNLTGTFTHDVARLHFTCEVAAYYSTWYYDASAGTDDPLLTQPGYVQFDARLSLETPGYGWGVDVIGKNLTSRLITQGGVGASALPSSYGSLVVQEESSRSVAAQLRYRY